jgi:hypothetical protein
MIVRTLPGQRSPSLGRQPGAGQHERRAVRATKMAEWFQARRRRVCTELTDENAEITVRQGEFWVKDGNVFKTPFGNKATHGYVLQEVDPKTGADKGTTRASFGWPVISHADEQFPGSITEVPPRPYGRRGGVAGALAA